MESLHQWVNSWAVQSLDVLYLSYPLYFLAGLLASLFPCVYPLYPITAGFLRNRSEQSTWKHPFIYWFGMVLAYTILGSLAATMGSAFNQVMQSGIFTVCTGFLFLFLSFVSLDWYALHWSMGENLQNRISYQGGSLFTMLMGLLAGLIASACVAPVLVSMLLLVAQNSGNTNEMNFYPILYGASLCFSFGAGIALPFFITGVLGGRLPRSGNWLLVVKYSFSLAIALVAFYQIDKGLQIMGFANTEIYFILSGLAFLFLAVFLGLKPPAREDRRAQTCFYFALIALSFGIAFIVRGIVYQKVPHYVQNKAPLYEDIGKLRFHRNFLYTLELAKKEKKPIFIDFYAEWCANCKDFNNLLQTNQKLQSALDKAILLKIYDTDPEFEDFSHDTRFPELKIGLPFFVVLDHKGKLIWKTTNYRDTKGMQKAILQN